MGLSEKKQFDLILKGGNIIDPANNINGKMDIAIADKFIAKIDKEIDIEKARNVVDVSGMVIVPGLIDLHAHFFGYFASVQPDPHCIPNGTTTAVDAGGSGYKTFDEFNSRVITKSITRVFALLNIAGEGMVGEPEQDLEGMSTEFTAKKIRQREDLIVGGQSSPLCWTGMGTIRSRCGSSKGNRHIFNGGPNTTIIKAYG